MWKKFCAALLLMLLLPACALAEVVISEIMILQRHLREWTCLRLD